ncbi:MAG: DMT family transporter, partial [Geminicoccaceae bacterium]
APTVRAPTATSAGDELPVAPATGGRSQTEVAMLMMAAGVIVIPGIDAIAKHLSDTLAPGQIAASRFLFQLVFLLPIVLVTCRPLRSECLGLNAMRGGLIAAATLLFFWGLHHLPLADAIAIFFVEPLILTLISAVFLRERVGWRRLTAIVVGFIGALLVIRPSFETIGGPALLPLGAAACFAVYLALTRRVAAVDDVMTMQLWSGVFGLILLGAALAGGEVAGIGVLDPIWPNVWEWSMLAALGAIGTAGHLFIVGAFRRASPSILAPFQYLEILGATLLGVLIFDDFPSLATWAGISIIVASGLYVFHRERRLARMTAPRIDQP